MLLGQTKELIDAAKFSTFTARVEIEEGRNIHRVLAGPYLLKQVFWPTLVEDQGKLVSRMRSAIVPKEGSKIFDALIAVEKEFRYLNGEEDPKSQFSPSSSFLYLVLDRKDDIPVVRVAGYKWSIYKRLEEIQSEPSSKDPKKLKNGLIFMYDVIIKKTVDDPKRPKFTTKYTVDPDSENNQYLGEIPAELLKLSAGEIDKIMTENKVYQTIFTEEELKAIEACDIDLLKEVLPNSEEEIKTKLLENPINLKAQDSSSRYIFPQTDKFLKSLESMGLKYLNSTQEEPKGKMEVQEAEVIETSQSTLKVNVKPPDSITSVNGKKITKWGK